MLETPYKGRFAIVDWELTRHQKQTQINKDNIRKIIKWVEHNYNIRKNRKWVEHDYKVGDTVMLNNKYE